MNNEEALWDIQHYMGNGCYNGDNALGYETLLEASNALAKVEKYKWHDLRKNPHDLPEADGNYFVYGEWGSGKKMYGDCDYSPDDGYFDAAWNFTVLGWREIEPFEEEE